MSYPGLRISLWTGLFVTVLFAFSSPILRAQAPSIEPASEAQPGPSITPGSGQSRLGPKPGAGDMILGLQPGRDELLLGRIGTSAPRAPTTISTPGSQDNARISSGITAPLPLAIPRAPLYGSLTLPGEDVGEGPAEGITLDEAIERLVRDNLDLRSKRMEIPQAQADVLTASLRANPILYADGQLVPYGNFSDRRPGGPTQYDLNISHPLDYSRKRTARTDYATRAMKVTEAQYQDAVRIEINNVYLAFVEILAARQTLRFARASVEGLDRLISATQLLYEKDMSSRADVNQFKTQREIAAVGVIDAEENLKKAKRTLGMILNIPPLEAEQREIRGTIDDRGGKLPPEAELLRMTLDCRPDIVAFRLGQQVARSGYRLAVANRYADAYLLYQPFTYQDNSPFSKQSATSWALGVTMPLPLYNRNQGNVERARMNIAQAQIELDSIEKRAEIEVRQAVREYEVTGQIVRRIRATIIPYSQNVVKDRLRLFQGGEVNVVVYLEAQRSYNDTVKAYLDTAVRHRRAMLALNTAVGRRILP